MSDSLNPGYTVGNEAPIAPAFVFRWVNRQKMAFKQILVVEDDTAQQARIMKHLSELLEPQGEVIVSCVAGSLAASAVIHFDRVDLVILDHDLPWGNGSDLMNWFKRENRKIPVITFSGIPYNNQRLMELGADYLFGKEEVISGAADATILSVLERAAPSNLKSEG